MLLFLRTATQWRPGSSGVIGLDYGVVFSVMDLYSVDERRQTFEDLQVMEAKAKELINAAASKPAPKAAPKKGRR